MPDSKQARRRFLRSAGGVLLLKPQTVFSSQANSAVEVGLVGCGNRGNWIAPFFPEYAGARIVAVADVVRTRVEAAVARHGLDAGRGYYGPRAAAELANSKLDGVIIETPPYFHPEHVRAAVDAGRHVFLAKPAAVDVTGCLSILEAGRRARGRLSFLVDFQTRSRPVFQDAVARVARGDIGKPAMAQVYYHAGRVAIRSKEPARDAGHARLRYYYMDRILSGDIIVDQNIHVLDMANWFLGSHPLKACGTGGRTDWRGTPFDTGDAWDRFVVTYWYPNETHVTFNSHQLHGSLQDLCVRAFGIKGALDAHYGGQVRITGENPWEGAAKDDTFNGGAITNVKDFVESIRSGRFLNNVEPAIESNLTAILGRMAAYRHGPVVTWDEMMKSGERWEADLLLRW